MGGVCSHLGGRWCWLGLWSWQRRWSRENRCPLGIFLKNMPSQPWQDGSFGWSIILCTKRLWVRSPVRAYKLMPWAMEVQPPVGACTGCNWSIFLFSHLTFLFLLVFPRSINISSGKGLKNLLKLLICHHIWIQPQRYLCPGVSYENTLIYFQSFTTHI